MREREGENWKLANIYKPLLEVPWSKLFTECPLDKKPAMSIFQLAVM